MPSETRNASPHSLVWKEYAPSDEMHLRLPKVTDPPVMGLPSIASALTRLQG